MKLNTGKIAFPIEFDNGEKECLYFNPNDPNLERKLNELSQKVFEKMKETGDFELNTDGTPKNPEHNKLVQEFQTIVCDEIDNVFGAGTSGKVFKFCSPFAVVGDSFFIQHFIDEVVKDIRKTNQKMNAKFEKKIQQHLGKYMR